MDSLITKANALLQLHSSKRLNGTVASEGTKTSIGDSIRASLRRLKALGFKLQNPENISEKHISALCRFWHSEGYAPKSIQQNLSHLRIFCRWMGKGNMVKNAAHYLPDVPKLELRVKTVAERSKSWTENGIDVAEKVRQADAIDPRFGAMLRLAIAFGLRRHEIIQCCPWKVDKGDKFAAYETKGGRPRDIYIDTPEQRKVLDDVKAMVNRSEHMGWQTKEDGSAADTKFSLKKWYRMLAKIGITKKDCLVSGHGLRAQYAENAALIASVIPPTLGGTAGQMRKEDLDVKRAQVSELLGHSRIGITSAYYGSFGRDATPDSPDRTKFAIDAALPAIPAEKVKDIPPERMNDCIRLTTELMTVHAYVEPRITQALWEHHSSRHCTDWLAPGKNNLAALEAAAIHFARAA
jgi:site-specific recombinase XerD